MYQITILEKTELNSLQDFIKNNWKDDHVFVKSEELLLWQHNSNSSLNYLVAYSETREIVAVLGFIPTHHFDSLLKIQGVDIWLALWKANSNYPGVGMDLLYHLQNMFKPNSIG